MAGGEIFEKTGIFRNLSGGAGSPFTGDIGGGARDDKMLVINSRYLYQVPWSFGKNWNKIKIGAFLSYTISNSANEGVASESVHNSGTEENLNFTWIGVGVNSQTKTLPLDSANQGFIGYMCNQIEAPSNTNFGLHDHRRSVLELSNLATTEGTRGLASGIGTFGNNTLGGSQLKVGREGSTSDDNTTYAGEPGQGSIHVPIQADDNHDNNNRGKFAPDAQGAKLGANDHNYNHYTKFFGMQFEVLFKGTNEQKIVFHMIKSGDKDYNSASSSINPFNASSEATAAALEELLTNDSKGTIIPHSDNFTGIPGRAMSGIPWTGTNGNALELPDSFMFYNAFSNIRPRISAWGVRKVS